MSCGSFLGRQLEHQIVYQVKNKVRAESFFSVNFGRSHSKVSPCGASSSYDQMSSTLRSALRSSGLRPADEQLHMRNPRATGSGEIGILEDRRNLKDKMKKGTRPTVRQDARVFEFDPLAAAVTIIEMQRDVVDLGRLDTCRP
jgi:hypothetical protein